MDSVPVSESQPVELSGARILPIDIEHGGIRLALPVLTVAGLIVGYVATSAILTALNVDVAIGCFSFLAAIGMALASAAIGDTVLKRVWPSGRKLIVDQQGIVLEDRRKGRAKDIRLHWDQRINPLSWRFRVSRGSARVQKGWIMLGVKLLQDEQDLTVYTFMPAKDAEKLPAYKLFTALAARVELESDKLPLREKSEQRRLLKAEQDRWEDGAEIRREDFPFLIETLTAHIKDWQAQP
jgi:hypothetical protein